MTAVLHTWGQNLEFHPHVHCVVSGGGLSPNGADWVAARRDYLLPVKVLAAVFRGKLMQAIDQAYRAGRLRLQGTVSYLADLDRWHQLKDLLYTKQWVVYAKPPFAGSEHVFAYLGHYTHRIAISNHRLIDLTGGKVRFRWKDYAHGHARKTMTLDGVEFLRRFLLHVLPAGYVRIRHYGLYASRNVPTKLEAARQLLTSTAPPEDTPQTVPFQPPSPPDPQPWWERFCQQTGIDVMACPSCDHGRMQRLRKLAPLQIAEHAALHTVVYEDTS